MRPQPLILVILDGFGVSREKEGNPLTEANLPVFNFLEKNFPFTLMQASGVAVGLPWGEAGNSEVGHLTMGAGRVIYHHLPRIIYSISDGSFFKNEALKKAAEQVRAHDSSLHLAGLVSSGSVHSYADHLYALLDFAKQEEIPRVFLHVFTDGKDAPFKEGAGFLRGFEERASKDWPQAHFASVMGRFYAMDRDEKWERTKAAYELLTRGLGERIVSLPEYLEASYDRGVTDEFIEPAFRADEKGEMPGRVRENDALVFFNFREDSMRQLARAFAEENFGQFERPKVENLQLVTMTEYLKDLPLLAAFPALDVTWPLARILGESGIRHLHMAETNKYAHVTYFFNGGTEKPFPGEERILVPSLAGVSHYEEAPEMKASEIAGKVLENFERYDFMVVNLANADLVGHTGSYQACIRAAEALDGALKVMMEKVLASSGVMIITADHGNIELKRNPLTGERLTEHSLNPVPFYLVGKEFRLKAERTEEEIARKKSEIPGILTDLAPTVLELLGLRKPREMTGKSLLDILR